MLLPDVKHQLPPHTVVQSWLVKNGAYYWQDFSTTVMYLPTMLSYPSKQMQVVSKYSYKFPTKQTSKELQVQKSKHSIISLQVLVSRTGTTSPKNNSISQYSYPFTNYTASNQAKSCCRHSSPGTETGEDWSPGGAPQGGQGGRPPPQLEHWGGIAPPTLGYNTKGCLRVHYCLYSVTVYTG